MKLKPLFAICLLLSAMMANTTLAMAKETCDPVAYDQKMKRKFTSYVLEVLPEGMDKSVRKFIQKTEDVGVYGREKSPIFISITDDTYYARVRSYDYSRIKIITVGRDCPV